MQVHSFYMGSRKIVPAREIIEVNLMEEFHWTPQDIANIPYKTLQKINLVRNQKYAAQQTKINIDKLKVENSSRKSGQTKRFYKEV
jgi:hypothetical protein